MMEYLEQQGWTPVKATSLHKFCSHREQNMKLSDQGNTCTTLNPNRGKGILYLGSRPLATGHWPLASETVWLNYRFCIIPGWILYPFAALFSKRLSFSNWYRNHVCKILTVRDPLIVKKLKCKIGLSDEALLLYSTLQG